MQILELSLPNSGSVTAYIPDPEIGYQMRRKRPGIIVAPGGAYLFLSPREGEAVALEFLARGYNVFVLSYSVGFSSREVKESGARELDVPQRFPAPVTEMMEAIHLIRTNPEPWNLDEKRLYLMGFSAGAHLCAAVGTSWDREQYTKNLSFRPAGEELKAAGMVLGYPLFNPVPEEACGIADTTKPERCLMREFMFGKITPDAEEENELNLLKHVTNKTVPAFIWHSFDDPVVPSADTTRFVLRMIEEGVPCEYHLFDHGGHGIALANRAYARTPSEDDPCIARWAGMADEWMERNAPLR